MAFGRHEFGVVARRGGGECLAVKVQQDLLAAETVEAEHAHGAEAGGFQRGGLDAAYLPAAEGQAVHLDGIHFGDAHRVVQRHAAAGRQLESGGEFFRDHRTVGASVDDEWEGAFAIDHDGDGHAAGGIVGQDGGFGVGGAQPEGCCQDDEAAEARGHGGECGTGREEGCSFLKKRTKKLLRRGTEIVGTPGLRSKSFLLLFFKKEVLARY